MSEVSLQVPWLIHRPLVGAHLKAEEMLHTYGLAQRSWYPKEVDSGFEPETFTREQTPKSQALTTRPTLFLFFLRLWLEANIEWERECDS